MKAFKEPIEKKKESERLSRIPIPVKKEEQKIVSIMKPNFESVGKRLNSTNEKDLGSTPSVPSLIPELRYACENLRKKTA